MHSTPLTSMVYLNYTIGDEKIDKKDEKILEYNG